GALRLVVGTVGTARISGIVWRIARVASRSRADRHDAFGLADAGFALALAPPRLSYTELPQALAVSEPAVESASSASAGSRSSARHARRRAAVVGEEGRRTRTGRPAIRA